MKPLKNTEWVLFAISAPYLIVGWLFPLLMCLIGAASFKSLKWEPGMVLTAEWRPWAARIWKWATTLGRGMVLHADWREEALPHEMVHVRQHEDDMVRSFVLALFFLGFAPEHYLVAFFIWMSGGLWLVTNFLTAVLRGGNFYRDAEHERSAYAQTDVRPGGKSWADNHPFDRKQPL